MSFRQVIDQDDDGNVLDNVMGGAAGVANVAYGALFGGPIAGDSIGERAMNLPGHIAGTYDRGSRAGNQAGDDLANWWDNL